MASLVDLILHVDEHLLALATAYGPWIYAMLFAVVFAETGLVVTPVLPGDSLLFAAGALAGAGVLNPVVVAALLMVAAIAGDAVNYSVGRAIGPRVFSATDTSSRLHRLLNREHLGQAHAFFERHGGKAIVLARFVPIVRTFVPFVAGAGSMSYPAFAVYNVTGGVGWVAVCVGAGYLFGDLPFVKNNFSLVALGIVLVSVMPMIVEFARARARRMGHSTAVGRQSAVDSSRPDL